MFGLGNIQNKDYIQYTAYTEQNRISNSQKTKASIKIANNFKAEATFKNLLSTETENIQHDGQNSNNIASIDNPLKDAVSSFREKVTAFKQLTDEIVDSRTLTKNNMKDLQAQVEGIIKAAEKPGYTVYTDTGEMLKKIRKEIQAINSFEGFLLGVHDKIVEFTKYIEFNLDQFLKIEQKIAEQNDNQESAKSSLRRIRQEVLKALRCQANVNPNRALKLLTS